MGGMAEVFLARADGPMGFAKKCVVKRILPHFNDDERFIAMFLGEARLAAELNHPNLVQIFDFGHTSGQYFLAMEFIDGPNLRTLNLEARKKFGPMGFALAARIMALATEGLHYAHELRSESGEFLNLVHRDISPDNILVSRTGGVKVVDFGIAKATSQPHLTKSGMIKGKMAYMAPEQLAREPLDRRADIFALGIVLYELVSGRMPFDATSEVSIIQAIMSQTPLERPSAYRPDCPPQLEAIIGRCLEKDRESRYASCLELHADLEAFILSTGTSVGSREIAAIVEAISPAESDSSTATGPEVALEATVPSGESAERVVSVSDTSPSLSPPAPQPAPPTLKILLATAAVIALGIGVWFTSQPPPPVAVPEPNPVVDAGGAAVEEVAPPDASLVGADEGVEDAGPVGEEAVVDAGPVKEDVRVAPVPVKMGHLELRIRPYATVYLDDKKLGDTPLPTQTIPVGKHKVRLVNAALAKDIDLVVVIKPGENVVKYNLKE